MQQLTTYHSLCGGYFCATPFDKSIPTSIRSNNPGAINGATWERNYPGYVTEVETTPGNKTTIFEAPEYGVAAWWHLLRNYNLGGASTVEQIITRYGGGQDYSAYLKAITDWSGLPASFTIKLDDNPSLMKFGKAMFRYEAGKSIPWSDDQIIAGIKLGQGHAVSIPAAPHVVPVPVQQNFFVWLLELILGIFKKGK